MELAFRETRPCDIEDLFSVRARTRQNPIPKERLAHYRITSASSAENMASGKERGWSCFRDSVLVGFCAGDSSTGEILVLAILPEYEGKGIGTRLLTMTVGWLQSIGFEQPWLAVSSDPKIRAHGFYRALGWKPTGKRLENGDEILRFESDKALRRTHEDAYR